MLTYSYDAEGRTTRREDSLGGVQTSVYNAAGQLTSRQFGGSGQTQARVDFAYTSRGEQSSVTRYSDLAGTAVLGTSVYGYDDAGRLTGVVNKGNANATLSYYSYSHDAANRVGAQTYFSQVGTLTYSGTSTYSYDGAGQLTNDGATAYSYDLNGNRTMAGYQTGAANRLTNDGVFTYTYDDEGNLTQKSKGAGLETWYYGYDNANRMTNVRKTSNGSTDLLLLTYTYDVQNNRVKEQEWVSGGSATEKRFAFDDKDVWADLSSGNAVETRRMFGDGPDQVLTRTVASGPSAGLWYYQTDGQGSVRDVVNASSQVKAHLEYDGYGVRADPQSGVSDRYGYTAREWHAGAGIQHNGARNLVPALGKWMQEDPIGFTAGDANLRRYVGNDPVNHSDPSGLLEVPPPDPSWTVVIIGALKFATQGAGWLVGAAGSSIVGGFDSVSAAARNPAWWPTLFWIGAVLTGASALGAGAWYLGGMIPAPSAGDGYYGAAYGHPDPEVALNILGLGTYNRDIRNGPCFAAGTPLLTPEGSKPIEQFQEGDLVLCRDENDPDSEVLARPVEAVFAGEGYVLELRVAGRVIRTTSEHPFWAVGKGWLPAGSLAEGDLLLTPEGGTVVVERVAQTAEHTRVYNVRVGEHHTYFVGCDEWGFSVWAHNACVYQSANPITEEVLYVGIANRGATTSLNQRLRAAEAKTGHPAGVIRGLENVTNLEAEQIEVALIAFHGRRSEVPDGTLLNIAPGHVGTAQNFQTAIEVGARMLHDIRYPGFQATSDPRLIHWREIEVE